MCYHFMYIFSICDTSRDCIKFMKKILKFSNSYYLRNNIYIEWSSQPEKLCGLRILMVLHGASGQWFLIVKGTPSLFLWVLAFFPEENHGAWPVGQHLQQTGQWGLAGNEESASALMVGWMSQRSCRTGRARGEVGVWAAAHHRD